MSHGPLNTNLCASFEGLSMQYQLVQRIGWQWSRRWNKKTMFFCRQRLPETTPEQPQLLMISSHAANGSALVATFSLKISIGGTRGIALVDSGSTDTFIDYTFASKTNCKITSTTSKAVKVVGGGQLNTSAMITSTPYSIQHA
jgi:hypothetical protein